MDGETTTARQLSGRVTQARQREGYATPSLNPDESAVVNWPCYHIKGLLFRLKSGDYAPLV